MAANELNFPLVSGPIAIPAGPDVIVLQFVAPAVHGDVTLAGVQYNAATTGSNIGEGIGVVMRGVIIYTAGAVAGTLTLKCKRNNVTGIDVNASQPLTLTANEAVAVPFEFVDVAGPFYLGQWFYTITATVTGSAGNVNNAKGHIWAA
jgi:hypothetical protein